MTAEAYLVRRNVNQPSSGKISPPRLLGRLDMILTERCNNNCVHCYINLPSGDLDARKKELSTDEIKNILKEAVTLGCMMVRFSGGEPLLREDFGELYLFARRQGLKVAIFTNATCITPDLADLFARIPPKEKIEITVYGMKQESYEAVTCVPGSFAKAWRGIHLLQERKVPFVVKGALLPDNKDDVDEFEAWAATIPWMEKLPGYSMFFDLRCRREEGKNRSIMAVRATPENGVKFMTRRKEEFLKDQKQFCSQFMRPSGDKLFSCGSGKGGGCVDAYGGFQMCMMLLHPDTVYDLKQGTLQDALERSFPACRNTTAVNKDYLQRCARCFLKGLCEQCPAKSWAEHGTLDTPVEYFCQVAHAQARFLGLIGEGEKAWEVVDAEQRIEKFVNS